MDAVKGKTRPTGDEIGDAYKATLPVDFRGRFPTLCEVYDELSAAIHSADETPEIYTAACEKVIEHFDARRMFQTQQGLKTRAVVRWQRAAVTVAGPFHPFGEHPYRVPLKLDKVANCGYNVAIQENFQ
jgi:hypothetical protein